VAGDNPDAGVLVGALCFSSGARWHVGPPTPVAEFKWDDVQAGGVTDLGQALRLLAEQLRVPPMSERALPPVLVLVSDGQPTDDFEGGLKALLAEPWGRKAVRIAIAIGDDVDLDRLGPLIAHPSIKPAHATTP